MRKINIFYESLVVIFLFGFFSYILFFSDASITGHVAFPVESLEVDEMITETTSFVLSPGDGSDRFEINSLRVSGEVLGAGTVKVYLMLLEKKLLVYTNEGVKRRYEQLTGLANTDTPSIIGAVIGLGDQGSGSDSSSGSGSGVEIVIEDQSPQYDKTEAVDKTDEKAKASDIIKGSTQQDDTLDDDKSENNSLEGLTTSSDKDGVGSSDEGSSSSGTSSSEDQTSGSGTSSGVSGSSQESRRIMLKRETVSKDQATGSQTPSPTSQNNVDNSGFRPYELPPELAEGKISVQNKCLETCDLGNTIEATALRFIVEVDPGTTFRLNKITYS